MLALEVEDIKTLMNRLLREEAFDCFCVPSVEVRGQARFWVDGHMPEGGLVPWEWLRPHVFAMIKGKQKPRRIKMTLAASQSLLEQTDPAAAACFINLHYEDGRLQLTTGRTSQGFLLDKGADRPWDDFVRRFLKSLGVAYRELL